MKKVVYIILQVILLIATIGISCWTLEEATKRYVPDWIDYLYVWTAVLWLASILSFVFKKKIISLDGLTMTLVILCSLFVLGAVIYTYYAFSIVSSDIILKGKINQSIICISLWIVSVVLFIVSRKRKRL